MAQSMASELRWRRVGGRMDLAPSKALPTCRERRKAERTCEVYAREWRRRCGGSPQRNVAAVVGGISPIKSAMGCTLLYKSVLPTLAMRALPRINLSRREPKRRFPRSWRRRLPNSSEVIRSFWNARSTESCAQLGRIRAESTEWRVIIWSHSVAQGDVDIAPPKKPPRPFDRGGFVTFVN